jgi:hypothetical protein
MMDALSLPAAILVFVTGTIILVSWDWRISIGSLAVQYIGVFFLVALSWPLELAAVKLIAGLMASAGLALAMRNTLTGISASDRLLTSDILFRVIAAILGGLFAITGGSKIIELFPEISREQSYGALVLIVLGLIHLGLTLQSSRVVIGLLTVLSGFGILYAAVESSILIAGLLAVITMSLSIVGAYLLNAATLVDSV